MAVADELGEHALGQHRAADVEPGELVLARARRGRNVVEQPVVERPVILELQRAQRMGDPFDGVALAVGEVIARIDAPFRPCARVLGMQDAVEHGIAQRHVAGGHVDPGPEHACPIGKLAGAHAAQQIEVLLHAALAPRAVAPRFGQGAAVLPDLGCDWSST
jgi:hypothetical protein